MNHDRIAATVCAIWPVSELVNAAACKPAFDRCDPDAGLHFLLYKEQNLCHTRRMIDYDKRIDCAAIKAPDGRIWTGKRHPHCIQTIIQATGVKRVGEGYIQGFTTQHRSKEFPQGKFVDRREAAMLARYNGQAPDCGEELYSEDLY